MGVDKATRTKPGATARRSGTTREECLVLTPTTQGGSWTWIEEVLSAAPHLVAYVVSYGRSPSVGSNVRFVSLPRLDYVRWGRVMSQRAFLPLNLLYLSPLAAIAWVVGTTRRPQILLANGVASAALLLPLRLLGCRLFVAFHSYTGYMGKTWDQLVRFLLRRCDLAFVNSKTSLDDLSRLVGQKKLVLVPHWAHPIFFQLPLDRPKRDRLRILFVGRLDAEKFAQCLRVSRVLAREKNAELRVVGEGPLARELERSDGLLWSGYVENRTDLANIYGSADVVWSPADSTYLSRPGVEGLAAGCPVIVSDVPAVEPRAKLGARVPKTLIPSDVGTVVNGLDDGEALATLRAWARAGIPQRMREACRRYAERHHGTRNRDAVIEHLTG